MDESKRLHRRISAARGTRTIVFDDDTETEEPNNNNKTNIDTQAFKARLRRRSQLDPNLAAETAARQKLSHVTTRANRLQIVEENESEQRSASLSCLDGSAGHGHLFSDLAASHGESFNPLQTSAVSVDDDTNNATTKTANKKRPARGAATSTIRKPRQSSVATKPKDEEALGRCEAEMRRIEAELSAAGKYDLHVSGGPNNEIRHEPSPPAKPSAEGDAPPLVDQPRGDSPSLPSPESAAASHDDSASPLNATEFEPTRAPLASHSTPANSRRPQRQSQPFGALDCSPVPMIPDDEEQGEKEQSLVCFETPSVVSTTQLPPPQRTPLLDSVRLRRGRVQTPASPVVFFGDQEQAVQPSGVCGRDAMRRLTHAFMPLKPFFSRPQPDQDVAALAQMMQSMECSDTRTTSATTTEADGTDRSSTESGGRLKTTATTQAFSAPASESCDVLLDTETKSVRRSTRIRRDADANKMAKPSVEDMFEDSGSDAEAGADAEDEARQPETQPPPAPDDDGEVFSASVHTAESNVDYRTQIRRSVSVNAPSTAAGGSSLTSNGSAAEESVVVDLCSPTDDGPDPQSTSAARSVSEVKNEPDDVETAVGYVSEVPSATDDKENQPLSLPAPEPLYIGGGLSAASPVFGDCHQSDKLADLQAKGRVTTRSHTDNSPLTPHNHVCPPPIDADDEFEECELPPVDAPPTTSEWQDVTSASVDQSKRAAAACSRLSFEDPTQSPFYLSGQRKQQRQRRCDDDEALAELLHVCRQTKLSTWTQAYEKRLRKTAVKLGEGVYGEVFKLTYPDGSNCAVKVVPIEGDFLVNDERQKTAGEVLPEVIIAQQLAGLDDPGEHGGDSTPNFVPLHRTQVVRGKYPAELLSAWDVYQRSGRSENDRPSLFDKRQLFVVFEFADAGQDLESYKCDSVAEACSIIGQVIFALSIAERALEFEHRDLHIGNVLVKRTTHQKIRFNVGKADIGLQSHGVHVYIIDFTNSRLKKKGCTLFTDLSTDDALFEGPNTDYQFDVYRLMREANGNDWKAFTARSNVLWAHYLVDKLMQPDRYKKPRATAADRRRLLRPLLDTLLDNDCMSDVLSKCDAMDAVFDKLGL